MTPEEEARLRALNLQVSELSVITELKEKDAEIIEDLENLKQGLEVLSRTVLEGFEKGIPFKKIGMKAKDTC